MFEDRWKSSSFRLSSRGSIVVTCEANAEGFPRCWIPQVSTEGGWVVGAEILVLF